MPSSHFSDLSVLQKDLTKRFTLFLMQKKYCLTLFIILMQLGRVLAQSNALAAFYDSTRIQEIRINFNYNNWDFRMDTARKGSDSYSIASTVFINGTRFDSVGVKYKGFSSYDEFNQKNPLNIELNHVINGQRYFGQSDIKLSNGVFDPSMVREIMAYSMAQRYMDCPRANFAMVFINGTYWGVYTNVEPVNKDFLAMRFNSNSNPHFKCQSPVPGQFGLATLKYWGNDSVFYTGLYDMKSNYGWNDMKQLIDVLNNKIADIEKVLDVDRALWMLAFNNTFVNLDSYTGLFCQNYYMYKDINGRFAPILWDLNMCFGGFGIKQNNPFFEVYSLPELRNFPPDAEFNNPDRPLISKLMANEQYRKMYLAHMRVMIKDYLANNVYRNMALGLQARIDSAYKADTRGFVDYNQFKQAINTGFDMNGLFVPGIHSLLGARKVFLEAWPGLAALPPQIETPRVLNTTFKQGDSIWVRCRISNGNKALLGYRFSAYAAFSKLPMFDDGKHQDSLAGDGVYAAAFPLNSYEAQYYVYAENTSAGMFSPERAEHEFHSIQAPLKNSFGPGDVVINEFMAENKYSVREPNGKHEDWIELYNTTAEPIDLGNMYLSDSYDTLMKWKFPAGTVISGKSYLLVWADDDEEQVGLHSNFKLASAGDRIVASLANGTIIDSISFGRQTQDVSSGRYPNGSGSFQPIPASPAAENKLSSPPPPVATNTVLIYPNPASAKVHIVSAKALYHLELISLTGAKVMYEEKLPGVSSVQLALQPFAPGIYLLRLNDSEQHKLIIAE